MLLPSYLAFRYRISSYKTREYYHFMKPSNAGFIRKHDILISYIKLLELRVLFDGGLYMRKYGMY